MCALVEVGLECSTLRAGANRQRSSCDKRILDLPKDVEAALEYQARAAHMPTERYVAHTVERALELRRRHAAEDLKRHLEHMASQVAPTTMPEEMEAALEEAFGPRAAATQLAPVKIVLDTNILVRANPKDSPRAETMRPEESGRGRLRACATLLLVLAGCSGRLPDIDPELAREIAAIKVIDNHGHPLTVPAEGEKADDEYDALVFEEMEPAPAPVRIRDNNPEYIQAWKLLYGYRYDDMSEAHVKELVADKQRLMREKGEAYPAWVLDRLGIDTLLANRVAMGRGLTPPRFRWVTYVDALMLPFPDERRKRENPDYRAFYKAQERLLQRHRKESGVAALPASLDDFEKQVVTATLERQKRGGAIGVKFEAAYLRSLDIADIAKEEAAKVYAKYAKGGEPTYEEYKALQDYLFRFIAREAGRLTMAVHIHLCGGAGGYYKLGGTNPTLLDGVLSDTTLRKTNFVLVHGGWPFTKEAGYLLTKPHVYADISAMTFVLYPRELERDPAVVVEPGAGARALRWRRRAIPAADQLGRDGLAHGDHRAQVGRHGADRHDARRRDLAAAGARSGAAGAARERGAALRLPEIDAAAVDPTGRDRRLHRFAAGA